MGVTIFFYKIVNVYLLYRDTLSIFKRENLERH
jgi:hypothetical protein